jgi:cell division protein FtsQ
LWPDTIIIRLLEQQAIAHWQGKYLLNSEGEIFDPAENIQSDSLPWLVGNDGDAQKLLATYHQMNNALHHLGLRITKLELTERQAWTLILDNGMKLVLGRVDPIQQITRFVHAYNSIFGSRGTAVQLVDLRYPNGIAVRWNKEKT